MSGTKVTDPTQEINEGVGVVTSDSLAAESLKNDGSFGEGNPNAVASKQSSRGTTTNNTDTSGATRLPPAVDAESREAQESWGEEQQLNAGRGLGKDAGVGPTYATRSSGGGGGGGDTSSSDYTRGADDSEAPTAGYAGSVQGRTGGDYKPKGSNLTEDPNLEGKTAFGEIGTENDPSRRAEQNFQLRDAQSGADAGIPKDTGAAGGINPYGAVGDEDA